MSETLDKRIEKLNTVEAIQLHHYFAEQRRHERRFDGFKQKNLTQGDLFAFMKGDPNERIFYAFKSGLCNDTLDNPLDDFKGYY